MTNLDKQPDKLGSLGAKRQSWKRANPRELLKRIVDETDSEGSAHGIFIEAVRDDPDMMEAIIEYWFANNYRSLTFKPPESGGSSPVEKKEKKQEAVERASRIIKTRAERMILLNMVMPNGKSLKECTGREVASFGSKFIAISKAVKPNEKIGVLSESTVRKLFR